MDELVSQCLPIALTKHVIALQQNGGKGEHSPANMGEQGLIQGANLVHQSN